MIKVGNILIDPNDISSIHREMKTPNDDRYRGFTIIQIIYKNGVVKNFTTVELGVKTYEEFIEIFMEEKSKIETNRILRNLAAIKSMNNE